MACAVKKGTVREGLTDGSSEGKGEEMSSVRRRVKGKGDITDKVMFS